MFTEDISKLSDLEKNIQILYIKLNIPTIFLLSGNLGAGKTTFTKLFCNKLLVNDRVHSPSFNLMNEYDGSYNNQPISIFHIDFYRLQNQKNINISDLLRVDFQDNVIFFIEWFEILNIDWKNWAQQINANLLKITLQYTPQNRTFYYEPIYLPSY